MTRRAKTGGPEAFKDRGDGSRKRRKLTKLGQGSGHQRQSDKKTGLSVALNYELKRGGKELLFGRKSTKGGAMRESSEKIELERR